MSWCVCSRRLHVFVAFLSGGFFVPKLVLGGNTAGSLSSLLLSYICLQQKKNFWLFSYPNSKWIPLVLENIGLHWFYGKIQKETLDSFPLTSMLLQVKPN
ncbi:hypothetical protein ILYODFUR_022681 [Ilyodon furcidens]|uniref:Uncharacterized protein n=1 Tax=Ilyodon furcidens TaxID=33524 RepID=A0ABV0UIA3_9TELE